MIIIFTIGVEYYNRVEFGGHIQNFDFSLYFPSQVSTVKKHMGTPEDPVMVHMAESEVQHNGCSMLSLLEPRPDAAPYWHLDR